MRIVSVKYINDYILEVSFYNKEVKIVDLSDFLKSATNPMTTKFRDFKLFKQVKVEHGHLSWGDSEMDLSAQWIYRL